MPLFRKSPFQTGSAPTQGKPALTPAQKISWLRLIRSQNIGPVTFRQLLNKFGAAEVALEALPELAAKGGAAKSPRIFSVAEAKEEMARARKAGARLVALGEAGYPPLLANLDAPPPLLYLRGNTQLLDRPALAIVGSRNASALGLKFTAQITHELIREDFVICSGFARGIDTAAHKAALQGGTIAIVAGGIDHIYPPENAQLHQQISRQGLLISERPPGAIPRAQDFPRRNRLISGTSVGTLVVEANRRSGSLITARLAGEQGRDVFAVPGHPLDPRASGTNHLIREGATLVRNGEDILESLKMQLDLFNLPGTSDDNSSLTEKERASHSQCTPEDEMMNDPVTLSDREIVVNALGVQPVTIDDLIQMTGIPASTVQSVIMELEIAGRLLRQAGQKVALAP